MKVKVSQKYKEILSTNHIKVWIEELLSICEEVGIKEYADLGIGTNYNVGLSVYIDFSDPHSFINIFDIDGLIDKDMKKLLSSIPDIKEIFKHSRCRTLEFIDSYDLYAPIVNYISKNNLEGKLKRAKIINFTHSLPEDIFNRGEEFRDKDVFFKGETNKKWYPLRDIVQKELSCHNDISSQYITSSGLKAKVEARKASANVLEQIDVYNKQLKNYVKNLQRAKTTLFCGGIFNYPVKKYFESMACGCLVLASKPVDAEKLGFIDGKTFVEINATNFMNKLRYYLDNEDERQMIVDNAYNLYKERYTTKKSVGSFLKNIKGFIKIER